MAANTRAISWPSGKLIIFGFLYLSEGGPIGLVWWAVPVLLRSAGFSIGEITSLTATAVVPWMSKFLWAPIVERWGREPRTLARWILVCQASMIFVLGTLSTIDPSSDKTTLSVLLVLLAVLGATQDIAIDGLAVLVTPPVERGRLNAAMQFGLQVGRAIVTGGALLLASNGGWREAMLFASGLMLLCLIAAAIGLRYIRDSQGVLIVPEMVSAEGLFTAFRRPAFLRAALYALTAAAAFEAAGGLAGPLLHDAGLPREQIGLFYSLGVSAVLASGGIIAGWFVDRLGTTFMLRLTTCGFVAPIMVIALLDKQNSLTTISLVVALAIMYAFVGAFTVSSYAAFMNNVQRDTGLATQFSLLMACTNACETWSVWLAGRIATGGDYAASLILLSVLSLASMIWTPRSD